MSDAILVFIVLGVALGGFAWGQVRYDLVALIALLACVMLGLVDADAAFLGFGHPAVVTVAAVLVLSKAFERSGLVDVIARQTLKVGGRVLVQLAVLTGTVVALSAVMNNVGALALMLPVAIRMARENDVPPSFFLMPLAFGSLLGGLLTMIGTPPNIIISNYRNEQIGEGFGMFSYSPVGAAVAAAGLAFIVLIGWRLTPRREGQASVEEMFDTASYLSELEVAHGAKAAGWTLRELREACSEALPVLAVIRDDEKHPGHRFNGTLREHDIVMVEAGPEELKLLEDKAGLRVRSHDSEPAQDEAPGARGEEKRDAKLSMDSEDLQLIEAVVRNDSMMVNRTVVQLRLLNQRGLHLVAVARDGERLRQRLHEIRFRPGDVLLLQGDEAGLAESLALLGCLPLANRNLTLGQPRMLIGAVAIFALAIAAMLLDLLPAAVALASAAAVTLAVGVLPLRDGYQAVDGPVIVLLGAMIPVGQALESSGGAALIAQALLDAGEHWPPVVSLVGLFLITMLLSNVVNNAAAALLMAPIAASLAAGFGLSADPFLMIVAVSASCAFLTPIGHQSNTLVLGPGGYRFHDYWKLGLPLSLVVMAAAVPTILVVWPL